MCEEKKRRERKRWKREIERAKTERQAWKVVNKERKRRKRVNENIKLKWRREKGILRRC